MMLSIRRRISRSRAAKSKEYRENPISKERKEKRKFVVLVISFSRLVHCDESFDSASTSFCINLSSPIVFLFFGERKRERVRKNFFLFLASSFSCRGFHQMLKSDGEKAHETMQWLSSKIDISVEKNSLSLRISFWRMTSSVSQWVCHSFEKIQFHSVIALHLRRSKRSEIWQTFHSASDAARRALWRTEKWRKSNLKSISNFFFFSPSLWCRLSYSVNIDEPKAFLDHHSSSFSSANRMQTMENKQHVGERHTRPFGWLFSSLSPSLFLSSLLLLSPWPRWIINVKDNQENYDDDDDDRIHLERIQVFYWHDHSFDTLQRKLIHYLTET